MTRKDSQNGAVPRQLNNVITVWGKDFDDVVDTVYATGMFETRSQAEMLMTKQRRDCILKNHSFPIWETEDRGKMVYRTKLPQDSKRPKKIQSNTREGLENKVIKYYVDKEKADAKEQLTLRTLWPEWIAYRKTRHPKSTIDRNIVSWKKYFLNEPESKWLLDTPLTKIDPIELEAYMLKMIKAYKMTPHTFGDFRVIISKMLDYAYRIKRYIINNPMDFIATNEFKLKNERKKRPKEQILFEDDISKFVEYAWLQYRKNRSYVQKFVPLSIIFMLYTGLRLGELTAVRFDDIDDDMLYIWQIFEKESNTVVERVKENEYREIDLIPEALEVVEEVKRRRLELGLPVDGFIFPVDDKFMSFYKAVDKIMPKYCEELGIHRHTPHDTRRSFVSHIHRGGTSAATIMGLTGHRDYETFEHSYLFDTEAHEQRKNAIRRALVGK